MKRDCYSGVSLESQSTGPQTTNLPLVETCSPPPPEGSKLGISHVPGTGDLASLTFVVLPTRLVGWECVWLFLCRDTAIARLVLFCINPKTSISDEQKVAHSVSLWEAALEQLDAGGTSTSCRCECKHPTTPCDATLWCSTSGFRICWYRYSFPTSYM